MPSFKCKELQIARAKERAMRGARRRGVRREGREEEANLIPRLLPSLPPAYLLGNQSRITAKHNTDKLDIERD